MTDLATLGIRVEGQEVVTADAQLDGLASAAAKAETATDRLAAAARGNGAAQMVANTAMVQQQRTLTAVRAATGLTVAEGLNLSRQFTDIGVTAAMGMNPLMIAIQQGPQLMDVFQQAAARTGASVTAIMRGVAATTWAAIAPLMAILAPIGVAVAALAAGWALASRSITTSIGDVTAEMNLTEEQLERLKEKNTVTTATMGDSWNALGTTIKDMFQSVFGDSLSWVDRQWNSFLDDLTANTGKEVDAIAGFFVGAYRAIVATWQTFPDVIADLTAMAANAGARNMNEFVKNSVRELNVLREAWNAWAMVTGNPGRIPEIRAPGMNLRTDRRVSGALGNVAGAYASGYESQQGASGRFMDTWRQNTRDTTIARVGAVAGDPEEAADRAVRAAREVREVMMAVERSSLTPLRAFVAMVEPLQIIADEMRLIDGLAQDMAQGLSSAFGETGAALGDLLTTMSGYQARLAEINLAEREYRLSAGQADRERAQAQMQNYGDMAAAARGFFKEGSDGYRVMLAIEQAYRLQQMIGMMQSMAMGGTETAASVANSAARGAASMAAGAAKMFEALGPWAFPAVAAMLGLLAGLGLRGGGGGGSAPSMPANDNAPDAATAAVRAQTGRQGAAQAGMLDGMAQRVQVVVTADREGMNAYVVDTAQRVAEPVARNAASQMGRQVLATSRRAAPAMQSRQQLLGTT